MIQKENNNKALGVIPVIFATIVLWIMYSFCLRSYNDKFDQINQNIKDKTTIVLSAYTDSVLLKKIIYDNGYCETERDAAFVAKTLVDRLQNGKMEDFNYLYALQKRANGQVSAHIADSCHVLDTALLVSRKNIGVANDSVFGYSILTDSGHDSLAVVVEQELEKTSIFQLRKPKVPRAGVPVRLQMHYRDSLGPQIQPLGYVFTDQNGIAIFKGLCADSSYSVLPIREGYEYGQSKGVVGGEWIVQRGFLERHWHGFMNWILDTKDNEFRFIEKEHRIPLFSNLTLRLIKNEGSIIVRTPDEFKNELEKSRKWIFVSWWLLTLVILFFSKLISRLPQRQLKFSSGLIIACCMFLSGLSVLMMFSMVDPVNDELRGWDMTIGIMIGVGVAIVLQFFDVVKRYNRRKSFFTIKLKEKEKVLHIKKPIFILFERWHLRGLGWLLMALGLTCLLFTPLGSSVGGMKVNLNIGFKFQPSEIAKYLIIIFTAICFTESINRIIHYSNEFDTRLWKKIKTMSVISLGLIFLLVLYFILSDMGPGLVLGITFVLLYSFSKSRQELSEGERIPWRKLCKCDFMMLIYGVLSYALVLLISRRFFANCTFGFFAEWYVIGSIIWLIIWVLLVGLFPIRKMPSGRWRFVKAKQFHETAVIMNLVIFVFILGSNAGKGNDSSILGRLEERTSMCTNTWGGMDKVYYEIKKHGRLPQEVMSDPVSNTQVAHGLWALASGGCKGQGLGNGKPSVIPAFHTDMILSSIGEQQGWIGLLFVMLAYLALVCLVAWKGINTGEVLSIFLCMGIAIVTAVQLFVIALGSSGVIPLTGVTVPLLSYGKVSMILNIAAFGLVLSLVTKKEPNIITEAEKNHEDVRTKTAKSYRRPCLIPTICFFIGCAFTLCVWAKFQIFERNKTLIQPAYVINREGDPVLEYNPRIALVSNEMYAGRIFDRNGLLLATSNKDDISGAVMDFLLKHGINEEKLGAQKRRHLKRYYPFEEQLFFMLGNLNTRLFFSSPDSLPVGYMAEERHLSYLRGFDNILYDKNHYRTQVRLVTDKKREDKYLPKETFTTGFITLYDYSALLKYLKDGSGKELEQHNKSVEKGKYDLHLTVDAALQKDIQDELATYVPNKYSGKDYYHLMRVSVVVLNAKNGDLLASANYPKPDFNRIEKEEKLAKKQGKKYAIYNDNNKGADWTAYTDRDLGTTRQTAPGSTAKVMSAMAGFRKIGTSVSEKTYRITTGNQIERGIEPTGDGVTMQEAIVQSSNCYFVNLVNDKDLYSQLDTIYQAIGASVCDIVPYYYKPMLDKDKVKRFHNSINSNRDIALRKYANFCNDENKDQINMNEGEWQWAWGQGFDGHELKASPLNMARLASAVVNNGIMPNTQYVIIKQKKNKQEKELRQEGVVQLLKPEEAEILKNYMLAEAANQKERQRDKKTGKPTVVLPSFVGGKTGTPERERQMGTIRKFNRKTKEYEMRPKKVEMNDGWYMFFIEGDGKHDPLAIVVRMERGVGSGEAVKLSGNMLIGLLKDHGYIQN